ncbi:MAG: F0F1 ATP synthase subunit beta, partial [Dehalococcoidia bacterium]|nr:F0F1 ATP synthase subunit beta [Dehalococcoidia bacterium]
MASGIVRQVIGTVVDLEFPSGELPGIYNAVNIDMNGTRLVAEVQQHLGNNWVRALALDSTDGLARGATVEDTGRAISVPVGPVTLGRIFNVIGEALDPGEAIPANQERWEIHRPAPSYADQETSAQMLETGIKVI